MDAVARGFTLIEVLVVLVIIGITVALIQPNLAANPNAALRGDAERLAASIEAAQDEAITANRVLAWSIEDGQLRFWQRSPDAREWQPLADPMFGPRPLAASLAELRIGNARAEQTSKVVLAPDGVQPAFEVKLELAGQQAKVASDVLGQISVTAP